MFDNYDETKHLIVPISQNHDTIIDRKDFNKIKNFSLYLRRMPNSDIRYVMAWAGGLWKMMHRIIIDAPEQLLVDHINHNGLDNRRSNLRLVHHRENKINARKQRTSRCRFKGIALRKAKYDDRYYAFLRVNKKFIHLGVFRDDISAAVAYDEAAKKHYGEYACLNFPDSKN